MPSSRRSQNLSLEDSLIFLNISLRSKKPSDKAKAVKADAARKVNADVAARIIVKAAVKVNTAGAAVKANYLRNFKKHIINNFKAAKKTREVTSLSFSDGRMLQIVLKLICYKRKELDLQRLFTLMKKRFYVVVKRKKKLKTSSTNFLLRILKL